MKSIFATFAIIAMGFISLGEAAEINEGQMISAFLNASG